MGAIKDRNGMDLTEAEDIKMRWQEYTEELYKKNKTKQNLMTWITMVEVMKTMATSFKRFDAGTATLVPPTLQQAM